MTITLTEREREVFADWVAFLRGFKGEATDDLAEMIDAWLGYPPAETSASPPRVPVSSARIRWVGVESGPGQPMKDFETLPYTRDPGACAWMKAAQAEIHRLLKKAVNARPEGYRAGIEAAANHVGRCANSAMVNSEEDLADDLLQIERGIRALADAPASDQ